MDGDTANGAVILYQALDLEPAEAGLVLDGLYFNRHSNPHQHRTLKFLPYVDFYI